MPLASAGSEAEIVGVVEAALTQADDSVLVYGNDGTTNRAIKTDSSGNLQVNVLNSSDTVISPATETTVSSIDGKLNSKSVLASGFDALTLSATQVASCLMVYDLGSDRWIPAMSSNGAGGLDVYIAGSLLPVEVVPADDGGENRLKIHGDIQHDVAEDVNSCPVGIGGRGVSGTPTAVTAGDRVRAWFDTNGRLQIGDGAGSLTVDNAGTFAVQATIASGATNIAKAEDAASADADVGVPAMAVRKATPANTSGADGDYEFLQMSAGRLWASATIDAALPAGTNLIGKTTSQFDNKSSCTLANVSNSASNFTVFSSNSAAVGRTITNDSSTTVYIKFGATASTTSYIRKLVPDEYYEFPQPLYTGQVDAIATSATGTLRTGEW